MISQLLGRRPEILQARVLAARVLSLPEAGSLRAETRGISPLAERVETVTLEEMTADGSSALHAKQNRIASRNIGTSRSGDD